MERERRTFRCCNPACPGGHFEATVEPGEFATRILHCPFCGTECVVAPDLRPPVVVTRGGGGSSGLGAAPWQPPRPEEMIPTVPRPPQEQGTEQE